MFNSPYFEVYRDSNPLTYIKASCKVNTRGHRWLNELASFNFYIHYKPATQSHVANTLIRFPIHKDNCISEYSELYDAGGNKPVLDAVVNQQNNNELWIPIVNMLSASYNDMLAEIWYKGSNAAVCSFNRDNIR